MSLCRKEQKNPWAFHAKESSLQLYRRIKISVLSHTGAARLCVEEADTLQQLNYCGEEKTGAENQHTAAPPKTKHPLSHYLAMRSDKKNKYWMLLDSY